MGRQGTKSLGETGEESGVCVSMNKVMYSSNSNEWETPQELFDELNKEFHFTLDPASTHDNAKCEKHYTQVENGLAQDWSGETVFCNPPYGRELPLWIEKAARSAGGGYYGCYAYPCTHGHAGVSRIHPTQGGDSFSERAA